MVLKTMPECPERCGGPGADLSKLGPDVLRHRLRHGCDAPIPDGDQKHYGVRCPACDGRAGAGVYCERCDGTDTPGFLHMKRCAASHLTPDIATALQALTWVRDGFLPEDGSLGSQAASFVAFRALFEQERNEALADQAGD